jgi:glutathione peroxidase
VSVYETPIAALDGSDLDLSSLQGKAALFVNVASKCGLTPQYEQLEKIHEQYADQGFTVVGFPCNQFMGQEPGTSEEIAEFCSTTYGVTFPLSEKIDVNGDDRHAVYDELTAKADAEGEAGDVQWNFEKFLISPDGEVVQRFRPTVLPDAPEVIEAIEAQLPGSA